MQLTLRENIMRFAHMLQAELFPLLEESAGTLGKDHKRVASILALIPMHRFIACANGWNGRPSKDRHAIACAFMAKSVLNVATTRSLIGRLESDVQLRRLCGWQHEWNLPHESTFSRAFAEFAQMELPRFVHEALIEDTQKGRIVGHIARDSTAIHARERCVQTPSQKRARESKPKAKKVRASLKGRKLKKRLRNVREVRPARTRIERQRTMSVDAMLREIPQECSIGAKKNSRGHEEYWRGFKLHLDVADGQIPITALLTSANVHDSQMAIPLASISSKRVVYCYDLMDSAYDALAIREHSTELGHKAIIDPKAPGGPKSALPVRQKLAPQLTPAEIIRFRERTMVERVYARLKDEFGASSVRVRGPQKVMTHLMFGVLALTADQLLKLAG